MLIGPHGAGWQVLPGRGASSPRWSIGPTGSRPTCRTRKTSCNASAAASRPTPTPARGIQHPVGPLRQYQPPHGRPEAANRSPHRRDPGQPGRHGDVPANLPQAVDAGRIALRSPRGEPGGGIGKMETPAHVVFCEYRDPAPRRCSSAAAWPACWKPGNRPRVLPKLAAVEEAVRGGLHAAGFLCYEAAPAMDPACRTHRGGALPLLWFGLFRELRRQDAAAAPGPATFPSDRGRHVDYPRRAPPGRRPHQGLHRPRAHLPGELHLPPARRRSRAIRGGSFSGSAAAQRAAYGAYLDTGRHVICSASPELFFRLDGEVLTTRPMKGTAPRGLTAAGGSAAARGSWPSR